MKLTILLLSLMIFDCTNINDAFLKLLYDCGKDDRKIDVISYISLTVNNNQFEIEEYIGSDTIGDLREMRQNIDCINNDSTLVKKPFQFVYHRYWQKGNKEESAKKRDDFIEKNKLDEAILVISLFSKEGDGIKN